MAEEPQVQVVNADDDNITIKKKDLESMIRNALVTIEKKDYRATLNLHTSQGQVPDAMTAFIDMAESDKNEFGFNRSLDVKGTINPFQLYFSQTARFAQALSELENWEYIVRTDEDGNRHEIPIDLMSLESEEMRWLSLALFGNQSEKEIRLMRAGVGLEEETPMNRGAKWLGLIKRKKSDVYGSSMKGGE